MSHAVSRLRAARLAAASKPFNARGSAPGRCERCRLYGPYCICGLRPRVATRVGVCLLMGDIEAIKPSNTGWLIADLVPDTWAFAWSRTVIDPALIALLNDPQWQPFVVFPGEFVEPSRVITELPAAAAADNGGTATRRPLFVLLDGTWSEARKMFNKSRYLDAFPVLSLHPDRVSNYRLRRSARDDHFCTAEVAAMCLQLAGEPLAAETLDAYLGVFTEHYLKGKQNRPVDPASDAHQRLAALNADRIAKA
ncbi:MAG: DTW domain-containing protein [Hydrogenophaga sp.]|uniref:tRNA-uridine aminocarboxypropyltransferase n=1 Tax=Hydrogenophaga sp. TaxID=1904254 RepID=UPI00257D347B|nr:tRNA-uridine aminocarboxypropyltransferase [Hydrogenophaga sp.]MBL0942835.1 DTW domain-containing protein [Hydrogenophaga sp.]